MTPDIWKNELWMKSGHYDNYRENMFPVFLKWPNNDSIMYEIKKEDLGEGEFPLGWGWVIDKEKFQNEKGQLEWKEIDQSFSCKSMNCPGHCALFNLSPKNFTQLPLRIAEFGTLHRNEAQGSLRGLLRVRKFKQDDAHIFCRQSQVQTEIRNFLEFLDKVYSIFGFEYTLELSTRPEKYIGDIEVWNKAEEALKVELNHLKDTKLKDWELNEGDGAFYGPKIDIHLTDKAGRSHQCGTVQLDFNLPEKFDLSYTNENGEKEQPVIVHRAIFGSLERFIAVLVEHYTLPLQKIEDIPQLRLPLWLSRKQFKICTLFKPNTNQQELETYASSVKKTIEELEWRINIDIDSSNTHIKQKIKNSVFEGYHFAIVVGPKEVEKQCIAINNIRNNAPIAYNMNAKDVVNIFREQTQML